MKTLAEFFRSWYTYAACMGLFGFGLWYGPPRDVATIGRLMMIYSFASLLGHYIESKMAAANTNRVFVPPQ